MHNLTKIKLFRTLLWITHPVSLLVLYPFVLFKKRNPSSIFFFLDRYAIGGAQRVYIDILESVRDVFKVAYFTRYSPNDKLKHEFYSFPNTKCTDIHFWCDNLLFRLFTVHFYVFYLNRHKKAVVLSSNSTFFYDMLPFLNKRVTTIELLHNFSYGKKGMEFFGLANHKHLDHRMVIDAATQRNIAEQYEQYGVDSMYNERVRLVEFGVEIPEFVPKASPPPLKILYAGRGSAQKRIWLLNEIAEHFLMTKAPVEFTFAGSMADELSEIVRNRCRVYREVGERAAMNRLYSESHIIILTSAFEGFPLVIKEGMSLGCVPVVTALPGNKVHLLHLQNALLMEDPADESAVVSQAINHINLLLNNPKLPHDLSLNAYNYASSNFRKESFLMKYRELLLGSVTR